MPHLGKIGEYIKIRKDLIQRPKRVGKFYVDKKLAKYIRLIFVNPLMTPAQLARDLKTKGVEGVILVTYGAGNMMTSPEYINLIKEAARGGKGFTRKIVILNVTQCLEGMVEMGYYDASSGLLEAGIASGLDLTIEAALAKMYWALAKFQGTNNINIQLQIAQRGEQSQSLHSILFEPSKQTHNEKSEIINFKEKDIPGRPNLDEKLIKVILRIQELRYEDKDNSFVRVFLNSPDANKDSSTSQPYFAFEFELSEMNQSGNVIKDVTKVAHDVVDAGQPVTVTLVGINSKIWCRAIQVGFYLNAQ